LRAQIDGEEGGEAAPASEGLTEGSESQRQRSSEVMAAMEVWGQMGLGFEGKGGRSGFRVRRGVRGRHGTRGWPARGARMAGGGGDVWRAEAEQGGEEEG